MNEVRIIEVESCEDCPFREFIEYEESGMISLMDNAYCFHPEIFKGTGYSYLTDEFTIYKLNNGRWYAQRCIDIPNFQGKFPDCEFTMFLIKLRTNMNGAVQSNRALVTAAHHKNS